MKTIAQKRQATRRKNILPLTTIQIGRHRALLALKLHNAGQSFRAIRQILNLCGPDRARGLVAKARNAAWKQKTGVKFDSELYEMIHLRDSGPLLPDEPFGRKHALDKLHYLEEHRAEKALIGGGL